MSGIEKITASLFEECGLQCGEIEKKAAISAENAIENAKNEAEKIIKSAETAARKDAERIIAGAKSAAVLEARREMLKTKAELIDKAIDKAQYYLHSLNTEDYFKVLFSLAARSRMQGAGVMYLNAKDIARMPASFLQQLGAGIKISDKSIDIDDGFVLVYGDIEMNCTFEALFDAARDELKAKANSILFGENG